MEASEEPEGGRIKVLRDYDPSHQSWEKLLDPDLLRETLVRTSIYLASYELLKSAIVDKHRYFYTAPHSCSSKDSTARAPKDRFHASCIWFRDQGALDESDLETIEKIRKHRNEIAHELPKYFSDPKFEVNMGLFDAIRLVLEKVERWWIRIEMSINPDYDQIDPYDIPDSEISSGSLIVMDLIHNVLSGQDDDLRELLKRFRRREKDG